MLPVAGRPYIFRDPIHGDIPFARDGLHDLVRKIVDEELFQRLRGIRQNGVLNLVFHGAEHSRFTHSLGAAHIAGRMFDVASANTGRPIDAETRKLTVLAALLHDIGHGPFSHLVEEILDKKHFHHEKLTVRILTEEASPICKHLRAHDPDLPEKLLPFIDYKKRQPDRWYYAIVSSQLDAARLDYTARDAMMAGVVSHRFDRERLIGALCVCSKPGDAANECLAVDDRAHDVVENYLLALYHLYRSIYFHHTVRAVSWLLNAALKRARALSKDEGIRVQLFPEIGGRRDPLWALMHDRNEVELDDYTRLDEAHVWGLVQRWRASEDPTLRDLCDRLKRRRFPKALTLATSNIDKMLDMLERAKALVRETQPDVDPEYYARLDQIDRDGYAPYRWTKKDEAGADPIWLVSKTGTLRPLEEEAGSMLNLLGGRFEVRRLIVPEAVRDRLQSESKQT